MKSLRRVLGVVNGKGGVGKTSLSCNIAAIAALTGTRTLLVDLDPQGNAALDLGYSRRTDSGRSLKRAIMDGDPLDLLTDVRPGLDVACGGPELRDLAAVMARRGQEGRIAFRETLAGHASGYGLVVLDSPPSSGSVMTEQGLNAARWLLLPAQLDEASREGLRDVARGMVQARDVNPDVQILGAVLFAAGMSATRRRSEARDQLARDLTGVAPVLDSSIRLAQAVAVEARAQGKAVVELAEDQSREKLDWEKIRTTSKFPKQKRLPESTRGVAQDYLAVTREVLDLIVASETSKKKNKAAAR